MDISEKKKTFYHSVLPSIPNSWEVDEIFESLGVLDEPSLDSLLSHVGAIWPVSHSLCFSYLVDGVAAVGLFPAELLGEWVRQVLGLYETKGLVGARQFMADVENSFLGPMRGEAGVAFVEVSTKMVHYLRGISGRSFEFGTARLPSTDTKTIFLPDTIDSFPDKRSNIFFYKLLISLQWWHVKSRIYPDMLSQCDNPRDLFSHYSDSRLAADLFSVLQFIKAFRGLEVELPGLIRRGRGICIGFIEEISSIGESGERCAAMKNLLLETVHLDRFPDQLPIWPQIAGLHKIDDPWSLDVLRILPNCYELFSRMPGSYTLGSFALLVGEFDCTKALETIRLRREEEKGKFVSMFALFLEQNQGLLGEKIQEPDGGTALKSLQDTIALLMQESKEERKSARKDEILLDNESSTIPEELIAIMREIEADLGAVPEAYIQAASGRANPGINRQRGDRAGESVDLVPKKNQHIYDEWDYRRVGYRSDWCSLSEKSLLPVTSDFVAGTVEKYKPQLNKLRRQFEMLRSHHRFVRKRRHGDDIDLDALVEAVGDVRAGLSPSDRLFVQLMRDERDISAMFLVDMSNSTEGWVGVAVKEALVLLAESLEVVGDRYGIYGFSGMRRSRSELFHIKHLDEPYDTEVQGRIAAISPQEYTRMGPPIRHLTKKLQETQSNVRLLVVISDGKPEDYDDYKGEYAIEDTRKALLEARGNGVYSFCITIDKSAHDYLAHMFGSGNYIFVDEVVSLPSKMAEMYRLLTS